MRRLVLWSGTDGWRAEASTAELIDDHVTASGTQLGADPVPYRLDYQLETTARWLTRRLQVEATGTGWRRSLDLRSDGAGRWTIEASYDGDVDLPPPGGDPAAVAGALDSDLGASPLTNLMPVRRHDLHRSPGELDFLMAWVSVPDLAVTPSRQRYETVRAAADGAGAVVRYVGEHRAFTAELVLDADGLVVDYPGLATRVAG
jgi:uncharacterized protein